MNASGTTTVGKNFWDSAEWQGPFFERLALLCQACGLTELEARSVNCCARGLSLVMAGQLLGLEGTPKQIKGAMWHNLHRASGKLEAFVYSRQRSRPPSERRASTSSNKFLWDVLSVMRTTDCKPRPLTYDERGTPVTVRGRLVIPDDLKRESRPQPDWLDDLCVTLGAKLVENQGSDEREEERWRRKPRGKSPGGANAKT